MPPALLFPGGRLQFSLVQRAGEFDAPSRTALLELALIFDKCRMLASQNPAVPVGGLLADHLCHYSLHTPDVNFQHVSCCFEGVTTEREVFCVSGRYHELHELGL